MADRASLRVVLLSSGSVLLAMGKVTARSCAEGGEGRRCRTVVGKLTRNPALDCTPGGIYSEVRSTAIL